MPSPPRVAAPIGPPPEELVGSDRRRARTLPGSTSNHDAGSAAADLESAWMPFRRGPRACVAHRAVPGATLSFLEAPSGDVGAGSNLPRNARGLDGVEVTT